jgi:hypothetical protein
VLDCAGLCGGLDWVVGWAKLGFGLGCAVVFAGLGCGGLGFGVVWAAVRNGLPCR